MYLGRGWQIFPVKAQAVTILGFVGLMMSVITTQLHHMKHTHVKQHAIK